MDWPTLFDFTDYAELLTLVRSSIVAAAILGIVGAFVATYLGLLIGWYKAGESAGFIASVVGAIILLAIWGMVAKRTA